MKKNKTILLLTLLVLFFACTTFYFYVQNLRIESRNLYHLSELEDIYNTQYLNESIPANTPFDSIPKILERIGYYYLDSTLSSHGNTHNMYLTCGYALDVYPNSLPTKSGRQYCGYGLLFDKNGLFKEAICNYPCH